MPCCVTTSKFSSGAGPSGRCGGRCQEADYYLGEHLPDIAIVDLGLPDEDGLSLIRRWRSHDVSLPVLVLTAREGWQDKVEVLSAGADDYVTKPFHIEEVAARMGAAAPQQRPGLAGDLCRRFRSTSGASCR
jgi:two-component system response regulator PhoP